MESFWNEAKIIALIILILCFAAIIYIGVSVYGELQCINFSKKLYQHIHVIMEPKPPGGIGLDPGCFKEIHTHHRDGWLHLESNEPKNFTMGEFFGEWGLGTKGRSVEINYEPASWDTPLKNMDKVVVYGLSLQ